MKKLMIVAAIVCAAAATQAASIKWSANNIKADKTGAANAKGYAAFAFIADADPSSSAATLAKIWTLDSAIAALTKDGGADLSNFKVDGGKAVSTAAVANGMLNLSAWEDTNWSDSTAAVKSYAIVFNDADITKATEYLVLADNGTQVLTTTFADAAQGVTEGSAITDFQRLNNELTVGTVFQGFNTFNTGFFNCDHSLPSYVNVAASLTGTE